MREKARISEWPGRVMGDPSLREPIPLLYGNSIQVPQRILLDHNAGNDKNASAA
jgi:hypothetical protein